MGNIVKKILVANRGEIALRVVRTAREMGISTVAVYSEQDRNAQYVQLADESYLLSGDTYASTYLNEDLLIGILHRSGANAVHPGYGFLSEVPSFADKVEKAGAIWVGPHPQALIDLGDKITARRVAKSAQVPPVPGISEPVRELRTLLDFSHTYGYPVMMKRTDGGGGRGITVVHDDDEMRRFYMNHDAMQGGDLDEYFIEKFIDKARHVETQCGRDRFGDFTVYSTRDCSVQRRNQKLVEEAPAPFLPDEVINQLETYSRSLFNKVDYIGLGTCEFMVTPHRKVYFLEVNPRLQVEHTVSEEVCARPGARADRYRRRRPPDTGPRAARPQLRAAHHQRGSGDEPDAVLRHAGAHRLAVRPRPAHRYRRGAGRHGLAEVRFDDGQGRDHRAEP